ncbi:MAG: hypothetical protein ACREO8_05785, partial [Luteimonas sp.]
MSNDSVWWAGFLWRLTAVRWSSAVIATNRLADDGRHVAVNKNERHRREGIRSLANRRDHPGGYSGGSGGSGAGGGRGAVRQSGPDANAA